MKSLLSPYFQKEVIMKVLLTFIFLAFSSINAKATDALHGMVIFGKEQLYAYHLPMFHKVHNKQMVLTFEVPQNIKDQMAKFQDDHYLTFVPALFDLDKFIAEPFALKGDLYDGHFEKNGVVLMKGIILLSPKIVYLDTISKDSNQKGEEYKFFGTPSDIYALHLINGSSVIDQLFKLIPTYGNEVNIREAILHNTLVTKSLFELNSEYDIWDYTCRARWCDENASKKLVTFKTESLYFEDQVM